ncbi:hypothetical protein NE237_007134 [Protea cynaroides]|uniref:Uncharacterized protein n=1 Tax=Protea cynaroides TaxID=273540 RepID=A0A9Q0QVU0_9MAGN|nr:hypothetical protein NE237_007134 [Protea cynaroides]
MAAVDDDDQQRLGDWRLRQSSHFSGIYKMVIELLPFPLISYTPFRLCHSGHLNPLANSPFHLRPFIPPPPAISVLLPPFLSHRAFNDTDLDFCLAMETRGVIIGNKWSMRVLWFSADGSYLLLTFVDSWLGKTDVEQRT